MRVKALALMVAVVTATPAAAQNIEPGSVYGHPEWREAGEERRRALYEIATGLPFAERSFHFLSENLLDKEGASWGEYDVQVDADGSGRIVAQVGLPDGKYAAEYYFDEGEVVLVYETRYFVDADAPEPISRNFKGIAAWERLSMLRDGRIHYAHSGGSGAPSPGAGAEKLVSKGARLFDRMAAGGSEED